MKRNLSGINLDEGIHLQSDWELDHLFISCHEEQLQQLTAWLKTGEYPLLLGGQIGCGKSSLMMKAFKETDIAPDITLHFDQAGLNLSTGDFLRIVLTGFCECALKHQVDLSSFALPSELADLDKADWQGLLSSLSPVPFSIASFNQQTQISEKLADNSGYIHKIIEMFGNLIDKKRARPVFILASGIDKFDTESPAYFALKDILTLLLPHKTLFEVNAVHLFNQPKALSSVEKLFLFSLIDEEVIKILTKRMGVYASVINTEIGILSQWAGGNPRQAVRLLTHFETAKKNKNNTTLDSISIAIHAVNRDFFAYGKQPEPEIMQFVKDKNQIASTELTLPGDKDTARLALYGNWFFITDYAKNGNWPAKVNPLVKSHFDAQVSVEEPEVKILRHYAETLGISSQGLSFNLSSQTGEIETGDKLFADYLSMNIESPLSSNLSEIFDILSAALLSKNRSDRVMIAYKDASIIEASRSYLFAKANSYEYQNYSHIVLSGGKDKAPISNILDNLTQKTDIFSFQFDGNWTDEQLHSLDKLRDRLSQYQMIWWIEYESLSKYLQYWVQLRQLFEVFILEDELLGSLSIEDIKGDLEFIEELIESQHSAEANFFNNLKRVLEYLHQVKGAE
ncbi:MAG TPA: hypothetical protein EYP59_15680 [Thiotrichaceae bacterium]|nr:hypothetical protein [Thiotrichaceae bacterium]